MHVGSDVAAASDLVIFARLSRHLFKLSFKYLNCLWKYSTKRQKKPEWAISKCSAQKVFLESINNHINLSHIRGKSWRILVKEFIFRESCRSSPNVCHSITGTFRFCYLIPKNRNLLNLRNNNLFKQKLKVFQKQPPKVRKMFLQILQNSQENIYAVPESLFQ